MSLFKIKDLIEERERRLAKLKADIEYYKWEGATSKERLAWLREGEKKGYFNILVKRGVIK